MAIYQFGDRTPQIDPQAYVCPGATLIGDVRLAAYASVWPGAVLRGDNEPIIIGLGSNVQDGSVLHTDPGRAIVIAEGVTVGHQVMLHGCEIGEGSLIGMQAIILNGARIGRNCLIGAGALIGEGKEIPDGSLVIGRPGKVTRTLTEAELEHIRTGNQHYRDRGAEYRRLLRRLD
ncbi:MAG: gamma carbonic anhydrase family protein [Pigmentiphaga sp.]